MKYLVLLSSLLILGCGSAGNGDEESETAGKEIADDYMRGIIVEISDDLLAAAVS